MLEQLHDDRIPNDARLNVGVVVGEVVVFTITEIAGRLQLKLSGSILGLTKVYPH